MTEKEMERIEELRAIAILLNGPESAFHEAGLLGSSAPMSADMRERITNRMFLNR